MSTRARTASARKHASRGVEELKSLLSDAEEALSDAGAVTQEKVDALRTRMRDALESTREFYDHARDVTRTQAKRADKYVHTHPYQAVGVAAVVGALAGVLVSRRFS